MFRWKITINLIQFNLKKNIYLIIEFVKNGIIVLAAVFYHKYKGKQQTSLTRWVIDFRFLQFFHNEA